MKMLNKEEEEKLAILFGILFNGHATTAEGCDVFDFNIADVRWLTEKLKEIDKEAKDLWSLLTGDEVQHRKNPITIKTAYGPLAVAIWEEGQYRCLFCMDPNKDAQSATEHSYLHSRRIVK